MQVRGRGSEDQSKGHAHHCSLFTKNSLWQAKQSIAHTTLLFYGDCVKMCGVFIPKSGEKKLALASRQRTFSSFLFHQGTFDQKRYDGLRPPSLLASFGPLRLFSVSPIENKTERSPF
jgi:hypothetical protein